MSYLIMFGYSNSPNEKKIMGGQTIRYKSYILSFFMTGGRFSQITEKLFRLAETGRKFSKVFPGSVRFSDTETSYQTSLSASHSIPETFF